MPVAEIFIFPHHFLSQLSGHDFSHLEGVFQTVTFILYLQRSLIFQFWERWAKFSGESHERSKTMTSSQIEF